MNILGIDLAWGDKKSDGLCLIEASPRSARVRNSGYTHGDDALVAWVQQHTGAGPAMILVDAPLICPNTTGCRPVDKEITREFGRYHAGCHPANSTRCRRPVRIAKKLVARGFVLGWEMKPDSRLLIEVYPHPAIVRFFGLDRIVKYKKGRVAEKREKFQLLQGYIRKCLADRFRDFKITPELDDLLNETWTKPVEDRTDAFLCALSGYNHYLTNGAGSEPFGEVDTGFILIPK